MTTVGPIEAVWTALALVGACLSAYLWIMTWRDRRLYLRNRRHPVEVETANRELRTSAAFLIITLLYAVAGFAAMAAPSATPQPESTSIARWLVFAALLASSAMIIVVKILNIRSSHKVARMFERKRDK